MEDIKVVLVDDHDVVRLGIRSLLEIEEDIRILGEAANGAEAIDLALDTRPDVIVMDITMPMMDGFEATRRLRDQCPDCKVLALTVHEDKQYFFEMMKAGAKGYITKKSAAEELVSAIRAVAGGNVYLQPALARFLLEDYSRLVENTPADGPAGGEFKIDRSGLNVLSKRELQVVELVADGLTTPEIAARLDLSPKTVSRHREKIMNKLNIHSSTELVKFAIRTGLIDI